MSEEVIPPDKSKYTNDVFVRKGTKLHNTSVKLLKAVHAYNDALRELYPGNEFLNPSRLEYLVWGDNAGMVLFSEDPEIIQRLRCLRWNEETKKFYTAVKGTEKVEQ